MRSAAAAAAACMLVLASGCGFHASGASDDAHGSDAAHGGSDAGLDGSVGDGGSLDAAGDAGVAARATAALVLGAGRTHVGTITVDVQLGPGPQVSRVSAGTVSISGATVVQP